MALIATVAGGSMVAGAEVGLAPVAGRVGIRDTPFTRANACDTMLHQQAVALRLGRQIDRVAGRSPVTA